MVSSRRLRTALLDMLSYLIPEQNRRRKWGSAGRLSSNTGRVLCRLNLFQRCSDQKHVRHHVLDILLRVNAEESRAVGVSGSQSTHQTPSPFGHGWSHSVGLVDCWPCQLAVTPILGRIRRPSVVCATGTQAGITGVGGILLRALSSRHRHTLRGCGVHRLPFQILPRYAGGQAASEGRFGIRSVPTDS